MVKNPLANAAVGSIPGSGIHPGEENDNPLQHSGLRNPRRARVHGAGKELDKT